MTKTKFAFRLLLAGLCTLASAALPVRIQAQNTQQLVFTGLRSVASQGQFNAVQTDSSGNLYLLLDQKDGVRLLKTDPTATTILAQAQIGAAGDIGLALALDPTGNIYVTGTTTSSSLTTTPGVAFPARADASTNSFIAKFDSSLTPLFVTYTGSGRTATTSIAATADAVFVTGSTFSTTLPVTPSGIIQSPASGSFQNGFVEKFNTTGTTLLYATYLSALNGDTAPSAIAADANDNAYIAGYTTSTGYPTLNGTAQNPVATINTVTEVTTSANDRTRTTALLCLLPAAILFLRRNRRTPLTTLCIALILTASLLASGCGSGGAVTINNANPNLRYTPPGNYQYQVTATATTGIQITQTVTLNLTVTPQQ